MTYYADRTSRTGEISSWFYATAPAGTQIEIEADDAFTIYPLRNLDTGLATTISGETPDPTPVAPDKYEPATGAGAVIKDTRTKYFYTLKNYGAAGYFTASGFADVENFDTSTHFLTVRGNAHSGRVCEWLGEMGYAVNTDTVPAWLGLVLDSAGAGYSVSENTTGAERVADVEFLAYSGKSMTVQIRQLESDGTDIIITQRTEWRPEIPPAETPEKDYKLVSYSPNPLYTNFSGYVTFRYSFIREWTQAEYRITEYKLPDGTLAKPTEEEATGNTKQVSKTFYASASQHKAGSTDPNISADVLNLYAGKTFVGAATLTSTGGSGGGSGGDDDDDDSGGGNSGSSGGGNSGGSSGGGSSGGGSGSEDGDDGDGGDSGDGSGSGSGTDSEIPVKEIALEFSALGGTHALILPQSESNRTVDEGSSVEWLSFANALITCDAHTEKTASTGTLTFRNEALVSGTWTAQSRTVYTVTRRGIFYIEPETLTFPPQGGEAVVEFKNETPILVSPKNGDFTYGNFDTLGNAKVFYYPACVHAGTNPAAVSFDVTYTAEDGEQTAPLSVTVNPPTRTYRTLTVSPQRVPASGGTVTVTALFPENETAAISLSGNIGFLTRTSKTETPGSLVLTYDAAANAEGNEAEQTAVFTALFFTRTCDHGGTATDTATLLTDNSDTDDGNTDDGDDGDTDDGDDGNTDSGDGDGEDGDDGNTDSGDDGNDSAQTLRIEASATRFSCDAGTLTVTAVFGTETDAAGVSLFIPEEAAEWLFVRGEPATGTGTKTWTLAVAANREHDARNATLAVFTDTLVAHTEIKQADFPRRPAAFYRDRRLWNPTFF